jgi:DNA uptake protein ComE-like DNA-binding protein
MMTRSIALSITAFGFALLTGCSSDRGNVGDSVGAADTGALAPPPNTPTPPATSSGSLDPNTASRAELAAIPGLSDTVAGAIIAARPHASMITVDRLLPRSLTDQQRDSVYARIWKPINLNTATDAEILLIPGVGSRMLHEFKEYRPYTSIEQFRREIGKYVDKTELARLERYVAQP